MHCFSSGQMGSYADMCLSVLFNPNYKSKPRLQDHYVIVPPDECNTQNLIIPRDEEDGSVRPPHGQVLGSRVRYEAWISHVVGLLSKEELEKGDVDMVRFPFPEEGLCQTCCRDWYFTTVT